AFWGRGYATEAARASVEYAFTKLDQTRVISLIAPENAASIRVAERLGERPTGEWEVFGTHVIIYAVEREEWDARAR
nr:GNAT family N-acetyltransferase [Acidobacteriota bacterium]